jgi:TRAP-type C4-dicarboxylate transport system permease small subunit
VTTILWIFGLILLGAVIYLNFTGTQIIQSSQIHAPAKKRNLIITVWLLPVAGAFIALYLINSDIKKKSGENRERHRAGHSRTGGSNQKPGSRYSTRGKETKTSLIVEL